MIKITAIYKFNVVIKQVLPLVLSLLVLSVFNVPCFAQDQVCESAGAVCERTCDDLTGDNNAKVREDFPGMCIKSCTVGRDACSKGDAGNCSKFYAACADHCPGVEFSELFEFSDDYYSFVNEEGKICLRACEAGSDRCSRQSP